MLFVSLIDKQFCYDVFLFNEDYVEVEYGGVINYKVYSVF